MKNSINGTSGVISSDYVLTHAQFQQLLVLIHSINGITSISKLIKQMADILQEVIPCARCLVWVYHPKKECLWTVIDNRRIVVNPKNSLAGKAFFDKKSQIISKPAEDKLYNNETDSITGASTGHMLCYPVKDGDDNVLAVIQLMNTIIHPVTPAMMNLVSEFSQVVSGTFLTAQKNEETQNAFDSLVDTISRVLDTRDYITSGHSRRVTLYALELARQMNLDAREIELLRYAGLLHDIGKIGIPELILLKNKRPSDDEFEMLKRHAALTRNILKKIYFPDRLNEVVEIAATHHERINGTGYPQGLSGEQIPRGGKILAVCDVFDALTSRRPYEDRMPIMEVINILDKEVNESFEPFMIYHFKNIPLNRIVQILEFGHSEDLDEADLEYFKSYTLNDLNGLENIKTDEQQKLENTFMRYYSRQYRS